VQAPARNEDLRAWRALAKAALGARREFKCRRTELRQRQALWPENAASGHRPLVGACQAGRRPVAGRLPARFGAGILLLEN